ncbi:hypothetical protein [Flavobacterium sp.]|uniref:hypothetical protein n=1 Tax=Flavobacterium sp. TaxID=239 RepID=UPI0012244616|nr:hypothetical protein [Flavobacterium sp.]RZJ71106.1 MAG: hypothetical protein EOO49_11690 [Flavobacterium sp.]
MKTMGDRLMYLVGLQFDSLTDFASKTEINYSNLNQVKNNKRDLSMGQLTKLIEIFPNLNVAWLISGEGDSFHPSQSNVCEPREDYESELLVEKLFLKMLDNSKVMRKIAEIKANS